MTKTKEELAQLKSEYEALSAKLKELSEDELKQVTGGFVTDENISRVISLVSQAITAISTIKNDVVADRMLNKLNFTIESLSLGSLSSAKMSFIGAYSDLEALSISYGNLLSQYNLSDIYYEVMSTMNWS